MNAEVNMSRYIEGQDRQQVTLLPECLDDFISEDNTVRIVDAFINELNLVALEFQGVQPAATGGVGAGVTGVTGVAVAGAALVGVALGAGVAVAGAPLVKPASARISASVRRGMPAPNAALSGSTM